MISDDPIEKAIGRFGKYQTWILFLILLGRVPCDFQLSVVVFILPGVTYNCSDPGAGNATNVCPCQNPVYDESTIINSVVSEWNLICDRTSLASWAQSILQVGILAGSLIFGHISDKYGRKTAVVLALFFTPVFGILSAVVPYFWMFMVCRCLIGASVGGTMLCCYVLLIELSGKSFRDYMIGLNEIAFVLTYMALPLIAYNVREWRTLQLVGSVPWLLVILYYWLLPESPRWLVTMGKEKEAITLLTQIAKRNGLPTENIEQIVSMLAKEAQEENEQNHGSYLDLFRTTKIRFYTIISVFVWMGCAHTFFGVNQIIGRLDGNIYQNVFLSATFHAPGLILVVVAAVYLRRKPSIILTFAISGIALLIFIFIPNNIAANLSLAIIGLVGAYSSFIFVYLFTSEIFPTVIRNSAMGFSSVFARFGAFIAPFVVNIGVQWISMLIFSIVAFSSAILCVFLPETKNIVLLNTIRQTEGKTKTDFDRDLISNKMEKL